MKWELREHKVEGGADTCSIKIGALHLFLGEHKSTAEWLIKIHNNEVNSPFYDQEQDAKAKTGMNHLELSRQKKLR